MPRNSAVLDRLRSERDESRNAAIALAESDDFDPTSDAYTALEERATSLDNQIERLITLMGQQEAWNHDALFDYADRVMAKDGGGERGTNSLTPFCKAMWAAYGQAGGDGR